jgi:hypothetical protein
MRRALSPGALPRVPGVDLAARHVPASGELDFAGDWYDACALPDGRLFLAVGDVAGRGPRAASAMTRVRAALQVLAVEGLRPKAMLDRLNRYLDAVGADDVATVAVVALEPISGRAEIASAGHVPAMLRHPSGTVDVLTAAAGPPVGATRRALFRGDEIALEGGAALVCYTDGLVARPGENLDDGLARLARHVAAGPTETPPAWPSTSSPPARVTGRRTTSPYWSRASNPTSGRCACTFRRASARCGRCAPVSANGCGVPASTTPPTPPSSSPRPRPRAMRSSMRTRRAPETSASKPTCATASSRSGCATTGRGVGRVRWAGAWGCS